MADRKPIKVGKKYNNWTIQSAPFKKGKIFYVSAKCCCGVTRPVKKNNILSGTSKSCGCITQKNLAKLTKNKPAWNAKSAEHLAISQIISAYKAGARKRDLEYQLTREEFSSLIVKNCTYCGSTPSNTHKTHRGSFKYNGIDRWDNNKGYIYSNCVTSCYRCNLMKGTIDGHKFIEHLLIIKNNNNLRNNIKLEKLNSYYERAKTIALNSHDSETKVGAILIDKNSGAVIAEGYNGFVRGAPDDELPTTRPEKYEYIQHAELNLLCNAARHGISTDGCVVFCTLSPCIRCIRMLYQAGITEIYFKDEYWDFINSLSMGDIDITAINAGDYTKLVVGSYT